jgi:hypothetical protein
MALNVGLDALFDNVELEGNIGESGEGYYAKAYITN